MNTQLISKNLSLVSALILPVITLFNACTKPELAAPEIAPPTAYQLKGLRYFVDAGDRIDTTTLKLKGASVQNPSSMSSTQQVREDLSELVKTSRFTIDPTTQLPGEIDLSKFEVSVPQQWYSNGSFGQSIDTYSLSAAQQQKPYASNGESTSTINIPPKSRIDISRQIDAYQLTCSFEGLLENTTTGQRYPLKGKWQGLLRYNNLSVTLKQSAL